MESQYKKEMENIHAPEELIRRTEQLMKQNRKSSRKKTGSVLALAACAAMICLTVYGYQNYKSSNHIVIGEMVQNKEGMTLEKNMGVHGSNGETTVKEGYKITASYNKSVVPEEMWSVEESRIQGNTVWIGLKGDKTTYCAAFKSAGKYYYIQKEKGEKKEFLAFLKKNYF